MRARMAIVAIALVGITALIAFNVMSSRHPQPASSQATAAPNLAERVRPAGCDPLPVPPALPAALAPATPTLDGVLQALDASLIDGHRAFLRCLPDSDDLLRSTQFGMGRWLRSTLHLYRDNPLTASLAAAGATDAEAMSAMILTAYGKSLATKASAANGGAR